MSEITELIRPRPPESIFTSPETPFAASMEAEAWIRATFIDGDGPLVNPDHEHLQQARIGFLWTAHGQVKQMRSVVGQAEAPSFQGNAWTQARQKQQMAEWFGSVPDFVITVDAHYAESCSDRDWCALVEHELYHCAQKRDAFGGPKFREDGTPSFGIRGHDIEEFIGVVRRYGATQAVAELAAAAAKAPAIKRAAVDGACGTCRLNL